jgi:AcrR family transcriptional regulator
MPQVLKDDVRARILDAARAVFAEHGFLGATMATIAERAELGTASLYRYYPSKESLFDELSVEQLRAAYAGVRVDAPSRFVLRRIFEGTRATLAAILAAHEDPRAMREAIEAFWSYQISGLQGFARRIGARMPPPERSGPRSSRQPGAKSSVA